MWLFKQTKKELDLQKTYLRVQFLTADQKTAKKAAIKQLQKEYQNDQQSIIPYQNAFPISYRFTLNTTDISGTVDPIRDKMLLKQLLLHLQITKQEQLQTFIKTHVEEIQMFIQNEEMLSRNEVVPLYSQVEATLYTPSEILEVIYKPRSLWERIKIKAKNAFKNLPKTIFGLFGKILGFVFGLMGLDGTAKSVIMKMVPTRSIVQWLVSMLAIFFPMLAPLVAMASKMVFG